MRTPTPPPNTHARTCARSPSYLYSHVNSTPLNLSSTSATPLVGFASIGLTGTPGVNAAWRGSSDSGCASSAGMSCVVVVGWWWCVWRVLCV